MYGWLPYTHSFFSHHSSIFYFVPYIVTFYPCFGYSFTNNLSFSTIHPWKKHENRSRNRYYRSKTNIRKTNDIKLFSLGERRTFIYKRERNGVVRRVRPIQETRWPHTRDYSAKQTRVPPLVALSMKVFTIFPLRIRYNINGWLSWY